MAAQLDTGSIRVGPGVLYFKGESLGLTQGGIEFEVETGTHVTNADQFGETTVAEFIESRNVKVTAPLMEVNVEKLVATMPGASLVVDPTDPTRKRVDVPTGIGTSLLDFSGELVVRPLALDTQSPVNRSEDIVIPNASTMGQVNFNYKHDEERLYPIEFMAYPNPTNQHLVSFGHPDAASIDFTAPGDLSINAGDTVAVTWADNGNVDHDNYRVTAGTIAGGTSFYDSGVLSNATFTDTVTGLPEDGSIVAITVYTLQANVWRSKTVRIVSN